MGECGPYRHGQRQKASSAGFRGVRKKGKRFYSRIKIDGKFKALGGFATNKEPARAYDQAVLKYNRPATLLNFPPQTTNDEIEIKEEPKDDEISSNSEWV